MKTNFFHSIIIAVLFALACIAYVSEYFDFLKLVFELGFVLLYVSRCRGEKTIVYMCSVVVASIFYAMCKEIAGVGMKHLCSDNYVGIGLGVLLISLLIKQFRANAK
jgi:predicted membrane protein